MRDNLHKSDASWNSLRDSAKVRLYANRTDAVKRQGLAARKSLVKSTRKGK